MGGNGWMRIWYFEYKLNQLQVTIQCDRDAYEIVINC